MADLDSVFLAYNEKDYETVKTIGDYLSAHRIPNYLSTRDRQLGAPFNRSDAVLENALAVVVCLGSAGWAQNQLSVVRRAQSLGKPLLPILIGEPPDWAREEADSLFVRVQWRRLDKDPQGTLEDLRKQILPLLPALPDADVEQVVRDLIGGDDEHRHFALARIAGGNIAARPQLLERLRRELKRRFAWQRTIDVSVPSEHVEPVARGWLIGALVWSDPEAPDTRTLVLNHVSLPYEPWEPSRFWTLAAAQGVGASYLSEAALVAQHDPEPSIACLARIIRGVDEPLLKTMRDALQVAHGWPAADVLRALRVLPVPALAPDLADMLKRAADNGRVPLYELFHALSTPAMAMATAPLSDRVPGLDAVVDLMCMAAYSANQATANAFARFLAAFGPDRAKPLLQSQARNPQRHTVAHRLLDGLARVTGTQPERGRVLPGYAADVIGGEDRLGIGAEVGTLASIMLARNVQPPLAIGLFGDWGTGKSFFMQHMADTVDTIANDQQPGTGDFCSNVVQVRFNAWHYVDTNLWASLVSKIFKDLAVHVSKDDVVGQRTRLLETVKSAHAASALAEVELEHARAQLKVATTALEDERNKRRDHALALTLLRRESLDHILGMDTALRQAVEKSLDAAGVQHARASVDQLRVALRQAGDVTERARTLLRNLWDKRSSPLTLALLAVLLAVPGIVYLLSHYAVGGRQWIDWTRAALAEVAVLCTAGATMVGRGVAFARNALGKLEKAKATAERTAGTLTDKTRAAEAALEDAEKASIVMEQKAQSALDDARRHVAESEERLRAADKLATLDHFVAGRHDSDDYRKHLGLVSRVREDLEELTLRLKPAGTVRPEGGSVERIVLYIDDLDRCPAAKVVDVLQAVHLLLAYQLFVVVVGVDVRWLLSSLEVHYRQLGGAGAEDGTGIAADARHYLEKIFQIPYALPPMARDGYRRLVEELMGHAPAGRAPAAVSAAARAATARDGGADASATPSVEVAISDVSAPVSGNVAPTEPATDAASTPASTAPVVAAALPSTEALTLRAWETGFVAGMYSLIPSPRAAKRLINVYRVLKAGVLPADLERFEGKPDAPGEFRLPLLLLAAQIHDPTEAASWFAELHAAAREPGASRIVLVPAAPSPGSARERFVHALQQSGAPEAFPATAASLLKWIPQVSRFCFGSTGAFRAG